MLLLEKQTLLLHKTCVIACKYESEMNLAGALCPLDRDAKLSQLLRPAAPASILKTWSASKWFSVTAVYWLIN